MQSFTTGKEIIKKLESFGYKAFFVGGCVRDLLLGRTLGDIDIATSASPVAVQQIFAKVIPVGIEHGTVIVRCNWESFEVTTFRVDGEYTDQRHPDAVKFIHTVDEDLKRRDFTINALAMNKDGQVIDLFHGKRDLQKKVIRTVGNGYDRFKEDPLRIIRALRFTSQLGFTIEQDTLKDMIKVKSQIENLAVERVTNEIGKLFAGSYPTTGINYLRYTGIYRHLPIIATYPNLLYQFPERLHPLYSFGEIIALFHYLDPDIPVTNWVKAWKCSNKIKQEAMQLVRALDHYLGNRLDKWLIYELDAAYYQSFDRLIRIIQPNDYPLIEIIKRLDSSLPIQSKQDLALKGHDLLALFPRAKKGPWIKETITQMEKEVVMEKISNIKYDLKEWIKCNPPEIN